MENAFPFGKGLAKGKRGKNKQTNKKPKKKITFSTKQIKATNM